MRVTTQNSDRFFERLRKTRFDILKAMTQFPAGQDLIETTNPDQLDLANEYMTRESQAILLDEMETQLDQIEAALQRIRNGEYGYCMRCGTKIPVARLEALPYAPFCRECQEKIEDLNSI